MDVPFELRRFVTIVIPSAIVGFVLIALVGKLLIGTESNDAPLHEIKLQKIRPVLQSIMDENMKRFERYNRTLFKGNPLAAIYDDTQLMIDYRYEEETNDIARDKNNADSQFHRLLCRNHSYVKLFDLQHTVAEESGEKLKISIDVSGYDPRGETLQWRISVTPESCLKRAP